MNILRFNPPFYFVVAIVLMVVLHEFIPIMEIIDYPWVVIGLLLLLVGGILNIIADQTFKKHDTTVKPKGETSKLVTEGVYKARRHPMYLGMTVMLLGFAVLLGTLTPFLVVLIFLIFMDVVYIRFEEKKLEATFGDMWKEYRERTRRWI